MENCDSPHELWNELQIQPKMGGIILDYGHTNVVWKQAKEQTKTNVPHYLPQSQTRQTPLATLMPSRCIKASLASVTILVYHGLLFLHVLCYKGVCDLQVDSQGPACASACSKLGRWLTHSAT